ncbi:PAS/PAC sensor hybrid histidine kinase [Novosphingobium sp. PhB57]|uniref:PAS domain-containing protein n=1 Tax=Novosphingobium sp. PhB57 TaxID=2485107 RepID=UPI00104F25B5|nr:PAS domain-containing protein [Novosphingobium sp. PhB57]TCU58187.1 PAS/PAC sensor hybrid histidine kinase [Novosphingobium sp. PhB57]
MTEPCDFEAARLEALARYDVLDSPREKAFDEIAELAAAICGTPIAVVNFVGEGRQFFKAEVGLGLRETPIETSFCIKALLEEDFLLVTDATQDARFSDNPLVTAEPGLRFYAGALLKTEDGYPVGTLCVLDYVPRELDAVQEKALRVLARQALTALDLRRAAAVAEMEKKRLRHAQEAGKVGLFTVEIAQDRVYPTPELCRLYGLPVKASYQTSDFEQCVVPEDRARVSSLHARSAGTGELSVDYRVKDAATGEIRWLSRTAEYERDPSGTPVGFVGAVRDISGHREIVAALARSEERYRALFEALDDGFCIIEFFDGPHGPLSDYVHIEANSGYERQSGIANIVGRSLRDLEPEDAEGWAELYGEVLRTGKPIRFERYFLAAGRHIEVSASRVEPASLRQVSVMFRDIEARRRAEDALRASEAIARENIDRVNLALSAGAIIGTWFWDIPTDSFTVDEGFAQTFGFDPGQDRVGLNLAQIVRSVHPDDQARLSEAMNKAMAEGGAYAHQYRVLRADGRYYWIEANGRVEMGPDGTAVSSPGVLLDIEQRRMIEAERDSAASALRALNETLEQRVAERTAELMHAEAQLRQAQKMEAVGQLTGGLAHDFNNLLAGISGALEMVGTRLKQGRLTDVDKYLVAAQGASRRAAALTHRLLAFSRRQTLDPRPTNVNALVNGMAELIQRTVGPAIQVETVGAASLWPTLVDPGQLENALLNLCINARDAMPQGGRITIETANKWLDRTGARTHDVPEGQYLSLCVTDTGTGMTADVIAKAFDPFFTTKPIGQGTGLGLSMIYGFAKQSGGQVRIYSELGEGTTVCIYLPRHYGEVGSDLELATHTADLGAEVGETVLVVDDEPSVRMLVTDVLEDLGYAVIEAADSVSGLHVLQSDVRIDLLISDVGLPGGMNGRQMADAGRQSRPDLKVLFITGYAENSVIGNGHLEPGMQVLTKPFAVDTLISRVRDITAE